MIGPARRGPNELLARHRGGSPAARRSSCASSVASRAAAPSASWSTCRARRSASASSRTGGITLSAAKSSCSMPNASSAMSRRRRSRLQEVAAGRQAGRHAAARRRAASYSNVERCRHAHRPRDGRATAACCRTTRASTACGGGLTAPALTGKDMQDIRIAAEIKADYLAVSFPKTRRGHVLGARAYARRGRKGAARREDRARRSRSRRSKKSSTRATAIMVARGDLAVEVGDASVPALQKRMIRTRARQQAR